jgi:hydroxymethylglutaryl-CoA lyase
MTSDKIFLIEHLVRSGLDRVESASFVNPKRVPQMADAEAVIAGLSQEARERSIGLVLNVRGLERALRAEICEINFVVVVTDSFARANQGVTTEELLAQWIAIATEARANGVRSSLTLAAAFGCPFEGPVAQSSVLAVLDKAMQVPPDELALADTIGSGSPGEVRSMLRSVRSLAPDIPLRCHFHNTRNAGLANAWVAIEEGVHSLDASVGGIGGCPFAPRATGNIATEDLVWLLERSGVDTGVDLDLLLEVVPFVEERLGSPVPSMLSKAGVFP